MEGFVIILVVLVLAAAVAIVFYFFNAQGVSIAELKVNGQVPEIIAIYEGEKVKITRREEALAALAEIGSPDSLKPLLAGLARPKDELYSALIQHLAQIGPLLHPYLAESFRDPPNRPGIMKVMKTAGPAAAEWIYPFLKDPSPITRNDTILALETCGWTPRRDETGAAYWIAKRRLTNCIPIGPPAVPALIEALKNPDLILEAVHALRQIGDVRAGWPLLNKGRDEQNTEAVVDAIARWGDAGLPVVLPALSSPDEKIRRMAVLILDNLHWLPSLDETGARYWVLKHRWDRCVEMGEPALGPLIEELRGRGQQVRIEVIHALGAIAHPRALDALLPQLADPALEVRLAVVEALGHFPDPRAVQALVQSLGDDSLYPPNLEAVALIGQPAVPGLVAGLSLPEMARRSRAAEALQRIGWTPETDPEKAAFAIASQDWKALGLIGITAVDYLLPELQNPTNCVNAAQALVQMRDPRVVDAILQSFAGKPPAVQVDLGLALGKMGELALDPLLAVLESGEGDQLPVIVALGKIGDTRAARLLSPCLTFDHPAAVRDAAAQALGQIGQPALDSIFEILGDPNMEPRAAGLALGQAGKGALPRLLEAFYSKEFDMQILLYALAKIPVEESAAAMISILPGGQYGQQIRETAQEGLLEIGAPAEQPLINALAQYPADQAVFSQLLVELGSDSVDLLIAALRSGYYARQREPIIDILGEIGDHRALYPLFDILGKYNQHRVHINEALAKIRNNNS